MGPTSTPPPPPDVRRHRSDARDCVRAACSQHPRPRLWCPTFQPLPVSFQPLPVSRSSPATRQKTAAAAAAATAAGGASSRAVDRTIFWNLVVQFREQCLPITFLLADASTGERSTASAHCRCSFCLLVPSRCSCLSVVVHPPTRWRHVEEAALGLPEIDVKGSRG